jgi:hypothetical protein
MTGTSTGLRRLTRGIHSGGLTCFCGNRRLAPTVSSPSSRRPRAYAGDPPRRASHRYFPGTALRSFSSGWRRLCSAAAPTSTASCRCAGCTPRLRHRATRAAALPRAALAPRSRARRAAPRPDRRLLPPRPTPRLTALRRCQENPARSRRTAARLSEPAIGGAATPRQRRSSSNARPTVRTPLAAPITASATAAKTTSAVSPNATAPPSAAAAIRVRNVSIIGKPSQEVCPACADFSHPGVHP